MQKVLIGALLASTALVTGAYAADLGQAPPAPLAPPPPVFTWTGVYIGANVGAGFSNNNSTNLVYVNPNECGDAACDPSRTHLNSGSSNETRFLGGGQVGFNWQVNSLVFGIEADYDFSGRVSRHGFTSKENCEQGGNLAAGCSAANIGFYGHDVFDHFLTSSTGWGNFGTLRGRLGWAIDHTLIYATGGLAFGEGENTTVKDYRLLASSTQLASYSGQLVDVFATNNNNTAWGFTVGGGLEYALSDNWSVKAEYLYVDLDQGSSGKLREVSGPDFGPNPGNIGYITASSQRNTFSVVRIGLNYRFGAPAAPAPVVASY